MCQGLSHTFPNQAMQRTADQHCDFTMMDNLKLNLAMLVAERSKNVAFAISVSAALSTPEVQMQFATTNLLTVRGYSRKDVEQMLQVRKTWTGFLKGANSRNEAVDALQKSSHTHPSKIVCVTSASSRRAE